MHIRNCIVFHVSGSRIVQSVEMQTDTLNENFIQFDNFYFNDVGQCLARNCRLILLMVTEKKSIEMNCKYNWWMIKGRTTRVYNYNLQIDC